MKKDLVGKFLTFTLNGEKKNISGVVLSYNNDWTLIKQCNDYLIDGYVVLRNDTYLNYIQGEYELRAMKILTLKKYDYKNEPVIPISNLDNIIEYISKKHFLFSLDVKDGDAFDVVKFRNKINGKYNLDELMPNGNFRDLLCFSKTVFRVIRFDTDYMNSLKLITNFD
ncbi:MAG: hypothetical protein HXX18_09865 [Bacteroidetes bacterium]|nr:hypothetical protein [Bacteroidota bacterium]